MQTHIGISYSNCRKQEQLRYKDTDKLNVKEQIQYHQR